MVDVPSGPLTPSAPLRLPHVAPTTRDRPFDAAVLAAAVDGDAAAFAVVFAALLASINCSRRA